MDPLSLTDAYEKCERIQLRARRNKEPAEEPAKAKPAVDNGGVGREFAPRSPPTCSSCGEKGHWATQCNKKKKREVSANHVEYCEATADAAAL